MSKSAPSARERGTLTGNGTRGSLPRPKDFVQIGFGAFRLFLSLPSIPVLLPRRPSLLVVPGNEIKLKSAHCQ